MDEMFFDTKQKIVYFVLTKKRNLKIYFSLSVSFLVFVMMNFFFFGNWKIETHPNDNAQK